MLGQKQKARLAELDSVVVQQAKTIAELQALLLDRDAKLARSIQLDAFEVQSGLSRVRWAEGLIRQLPEDHDGRNSWLMNYGGRHIHKGPGDDCGVCGKDFRDPIHLRAGEPKP